MMNRAELTNLIRLKALDIGFDACGFAKVTHLDDEARRLEQWLNQKKHASMSWMELHFDKRVDPSLLVPDSKTVISVLASYHHPSHQNSLEHKNKPQIAKYAQGRDYHKVIKRKLKQLYQFIEEQVGEVHGRIFVDSAPVLDKAWAQRAGLGWIGKNGNLLNKEIGSWFLIGEIILDLKLDYDRPVTDHCGSCTKCMQACPTQAIYEPYQIDANKCISYLTIEHDGAIDSKYHEAMGNWLFGCDICQEVCPWNSHAMMAMFTDLHPRSLIKLNNLSDYLAMDKISFENSFEGSPVRRTKFEGFSRNRAIVEKNFK